MSDSVWPHRWQPTRLPRPWDSPGKNTGVGCHFLLQCMKVKVKSLSRVRLLATPWTAAYHAPLSMGFSRQEYWSGVPLPCLSSALFCTPKTNLPVPPGISWLPTFAFQPPAMKRTSFFLVLLLEGLVGLHRTDLLQLLWHQWLEHRPGLLWCWMVCLGKEPRSFCHFWDCTQVLHFGLFCWLWGLLHFF